MHDGEKAGANPSLFSCFCFFVMDSRVSGWGSNRELDKCGSLLLMKKIRKYHDSAIRKDAKFFKIWYVVEFGLMFCHLYYIVSALWLGSGRGLWVFRQ